jgi:hypothetical protein
MIVATVGLFGTAVATADSHGDAPEFLAQTYHVEVLPGHGLDFEKAYKKHLEMHVEAGDPTEIHVWEVIVGKNLGSYYIRSQGFTWAEMDTSTEVPNDREHIMETVSPHISSLSSMISEMMPKVSNWPADYGVPNMVEVTMFSLDYEQIDDFFYGMHKLHSIIMEHEIPYTYSWSKIVVGGEGAQVYLSMPRMSWSEFKEPSPSLWEVAAEAMGKRESEELRAKIGAAIESEMNFVVIHRADLSYMPE